MSDLNNVGENPTDPFDHLGATLDRVGKGLERLPDYMYLYRTWERQHWSVQELDLTRDRQQWESEMDPLLRRQRLMGYITFFYGEIAVTDTLSPYINAMPRLDQRIYLTTQLADEARHSVFFDRWFTEVLGKQRDVIGEQLQEFATEQNPLANHVFGEMLPEISRAISKHPQDLGLLVDGVTLYHLIVEGTLSLAAQVRVMRRCRAAGIFPGFLAGMMGVARDESRHVLIGLRFLRDMVRTNDQYAQRIVDFVNGLLPAMYLAGRVPAEFPPLLEKSGEDPGFAAKFYAQSLRRHLYAIGIEASIPDPVSAASAHRNTTQG